MVDKSVLDIVVGEYKKDKGILIKIIISIIQYEVNNTQESGKYQFLSWKCDVGHKANLLPV